MAEQIEVVFGVKTLGGRRNIVLDGGLDPHAAKEHRVRRGSRSPRGEGEGEAHSMQPLPSYFGLLLLI